MFNEAKYYEVLDMLNNTSGTYRYTNTVIATAFAESKEDRLSDDWLARHLTQNVEMGIMTYAEAFNSEEVYKKVIESIKCGEKYKVMSTFDFNTLYFACNRYHWFTCGDNTQYNKLFELNKNGASIEELALVIYICSDVPREDILNKLREIKQKGG